MSDGGDAAKLDSAAAGDAVLGCIAAATHVSALAETEHTVDDAIGAANKPVVLATVGDVVLDTVLGGNAPEADVLDRLSDCSEVVEAPDPDSVHPRFDPPAGAGFLNCSY